MNALPSDEPNVVDAAPSDADKQDVMPQNLREGPHALSHFVLQAPVPLAMFDREMRYVAVSRPWVDLYQTGDTETPGRSHYDVFPDLPEQWREAHRRGLQGEHVRNAEVHWTAPDGSSSGWVRWELWPWRNESNAIGGILLFVQDISAPKAIDAVLRLVSVDASRMWFPAFAKHAARRLGEILGVEMVQLAQPCADAPGWAQTTAVCVDGKLAPDYRYPLAGSPCDLALQRTICVYESGVRERFAEDDALKTFGVEAYGGSALLDSKGNMLGVLAVMSRTPFRDPELVRSVITLAGVAIGGQLERHSARAVVEDSERFNRSLLDTVNSQIAVLDGAGKIIFANEAWYAYARDHGADPVAIGIGANYLETCEAAGLEALDVTRLLREVLSGQKEQGVCEYPCPTPAGMTWYRCTVKRFSDLEHTKVLVSHEDVSDIRLATRRSQQVETKFRQMFDSAPDALLIVDAVGVIRMANRQAELLYQFSPDTLSGQPVGNLIRKDTGTSRAAVMEDYVARLSCSAEGTVWGSVHGTRRDGSDFPAEISLSRFVEDDETFYIVAVRDVSLRLAAEADRLARELAEQASQAKSIFLATMSHEIRTPLNAVLGFAEVLSHSKLDTDQSSLLQHMRGSAQHLLGLIDNVLDLSKIEAGEMALEREAFDLPALILDNARSLSGYAFQRNVRISLFVDPSVPARIVSDPSRLRQVVYNLLGNAIKFSGGRSGVGHVVLRAESVGGAVPVLRLTVRDDGIGMSDMVRARVFEPFMQGESTITRRFGGTGLGLAITKRIVDRLNGQITVDSAPEAGSTFIVTLPLEPVAPQTPPPKQRLRDVHCLLAESKAYLVEDLMRYLHHEGARVTQLKPADDAATLQAAAADVVITGPDFAAEAVLPAALPRVLLCDRASDPALPGSDIAADNTLANATCLRTDLLTGDALVIAVQRACGNSRAHAAAPESATAGSTTAPHFDASQYLPLLVVEDDLMNQKVILRQLALLGLQPDLAENGAVALEMWHKKPYGLILADLHMPVMDGYAMTAAIRAREAEAGLDSRHAVSIVALTANVLRDEIGRTRDAGFDGFLTKPMTLALLGETLSAYLTPVGGRD